MLALVRATRCLPSNTAIPRAFTRPDISRISLWCSRNSSNLTRDEFVHGRVDQRPEKSTGQSDGPDLSQLALADDSKRRSPWTIHPQKGRTQYRDQSPHPVMPKELQLPPRKNRPKDHRKLVRDLTSNDLENLAPSSKLSPLDMANMLRHPMERPMLVRKDYVKPRPKGVTFSDLREDTTIKDVLLAIREAAVAGTIGQNESRVADARIRHARVRDNKAPAAMVARVEFVSSFGAEQMHLLSKTGRFQILGVVPRTTLTLARTLPKHPFTGAREGTTVAGGSTGAYVSDAREVLDQMRLKDKLVRSTHLVYNREPSAASAPEEHLRLDAKYRSVFSSKHHDNTSTGRHEVHKSKNRPTA